MLDGAFDQEIARSLAAKGGLGIAEQIVGQIERQQRRATPEPLDEDGAAPRASVRRPRRRRALSGPRRRTPSARTAAVGAHALGRRAMRAVGGRLPVEGEISSPFGHAAAIPSRAKPRFHAGVDVAAPRGTRDPSGGGRRGGLQRLAAAAGGTRRRGAPCGWSGHELCACRADARPCGSTCCRGRGRRDGRLERPRERAAPAFRCQRATAKPSIRRGFSSGSRPVVPRPRRARRIDMSDGRARSRPGFKSGRPAGRYPDRARGSRTSARERPMRITRRPATTIPGLGDTARGRRGRDAGARGRRRRRSPTACSSRRRRACAQRLKAEIGDPVRGCRRTDRIAALQAAGRQPDLRAEPAGGRRASARRARRRPAVLMHDA